ncbi:MAG TPA: cytochrome c biogenesis protein CcdA [Thermoplasmata archaeon]|nr:cytochrome c biogenesis protein CcdA [Thermoplasmata archaeon]
MNGLRRLPLPRAALLVAAVAALVATSGLLLVTEAAASAPLAPNFTLNDIYGQPVTLSNFRTNSVVVIEFTSLSCSACQIVEKSLSSIYAGYNRTGTTDVHMLSIYIEPSFGDTIPALKAYHNANNITWLMAQDTPSLSVSHAYGVSDIPQVFVIDEGGHAVYQGSGIQSQSTIQSSISNALTGHAAAISIVSLSVFVLAAVAGVTTFFSPCAFPMFPGYMSLFLGLNVNASQTGKGAYSSATRRALAAGTLSALGMLIVFLLLGVALIYAASLISGDIKFLLVIVGGVLIVLGALLVTNLQYWRIITPLQNLWGRITGRDANAPVPVAAAATGGSLYLKVFGYGMGYAAAAAGCVFPVILSVVVAGMALGFLSGLVTILIFALTAAVLMVGVTLILAVAGQRYVNQLKAWTPIIKKVSAVALVIVGVYLIYFYYTAWIA